MINSIGRRCLGFDAFDAFGAVGVFGPVYSVVLGHSYPIHRQAIADIHTTPTK